ncbi:YqjF family protein [Pseudalkalibacillus hwajinpoensis]|uniref:DUF2071 domain-containing protein n=1 Tax=Guptibacillus hwajinpoensis TaxID=208199 RepID=A0A4U1MD96_9BACL|nr:DUF2071 domain-containing protein [Pseudalkalibacillus hwajinpoensis]TKD68302.1 DUF2071 domain-containing protein [Pseudalkalibacillus hwajinpoensis]
MENSKRKGWIMKQTWDDLLFLHWPVDASWLQSLLPSELEVDTFDGVAWIGIVPFEMNSIRFRGLPAVPFASQLLELNVRTYVKYNNKHGVYFFSLDASHAAGVLLARNVFHLPYFKADMSKQKERQQVEFTSVRNHKGVEQAKYHIIYEPISGPYEAKNGNLDFWLTERDRLFIVRNGSVLQGKIDHDRWPLQDASADVLQDTLSDHYRYKEDQVITHFSKSVTTYLWPFEKVTNK